MKRFFASLCTVALLAACGSPSTTSIRESAPSDATEREIEMAVTIGVTVEELRAMDSVEARKQFRMKQREQAE